MKQTLILAVESSCDETAVAVVADGKEILSNVVATQIDVHKEFGGTVVGVGEVASQTVVTCQLGNVILGRGFRTFKQQMGVYGRHHLLGILFCLREVGGCLFGQKFRIEEVFAS